MPVSNPSYDKNAAYVVLPPVSGGRLTDSGLRAWLARSALATASGPREPLHMLSRELGLPCPDEGLAALRFWGQTGDRPTVWIAAADPIYLEPRLDRLCLHALRGAGVAAADLGSLFDHLQKTLAVDRQFGFARLGPNGYLRSEEPMATAAQPSNIVDQRDPGPFMPAGEGANSYRSLQSEIEMALHDHEVNQRRIERGEKPVNSLWLWGGGFAPETIHRELPPLFTNDPLVTGYWDSAAAGSFEWPGSVTECADESSRGFVAVTPDGDQQTVELEGYLHELRDLLRAGRFSRLVLLFRDGLRADVRRLQAFRFWRRDSKLLG
jgi:hypothetical protein